MSASPREYTSGEDFSIQVQLVASKRGDGSEIQALLLSSFVCIWYVLSFRQDHTARRAGAGGDHRQRERDGPHHCPTPEIQLFPGISATKKRPTLRWSTTTIISEAFPHRTKQAVFLFVRSTSSVLEALSSSVFEQATCYRVTMSANQRRRFAPT